MQGIYTYIPETNNVPKEYNIAANLLLLFMPSISLASALALMYFYISTSRSMCSVPNMAVFCSSLNSWFPDMVLTYFFNDFEMVPVAQIIYYWYYYYYYDTGLILKYLSGKRKQKNPKHIHVNIRGVTSQTFYVRTQYIGKDILKMKAS
jgi:hypothetical protein